MACSPGRWSDHGSPGPAHPLPGPPGTEWKPRSGDEKPGVRLRKEQRRMGAAVGPLGSPSVSSRSCPRMLTPRPEDRGPLPSDRMATGLKIGSLT